MISKSAAWNMHGKSSTYVELQTDHPAARLRNIGIAEGVNKNATADSTKNTYTLLLRNVFWKTTRAKSCHGRPNDADPVPCTIEESITYQLGSSVDLPEAVMNPVDTVYRRVLATIS